MKKAYPMTEEGKKQLEKELFYLKEEKQKEINDEIKEHHSFCDFSDNASFDQILDEQALLKKQITEIQDMLAYAEILSPKENGETAARLGDTVHFMELPDGPEESYTIVGSKEANPIENKISLESPIGKALLTKEVDDEFSIQIPAGEMKVKILKIS